ncbi:MAG: DUF1844 domain-containing protein [Verrucomicrobiota bacterium]|jgi:hypothetical protein
MNDPQVSESRPANSTRNEELSTLFAHLVVQQSNLAMMLLGKLAQPETGQVTRDLEAARLFIDQLEMLEVKTKGNLTKAEAALLSQSLLSLRLAFVEAVESAPPAQSRETASPTPPAQTGAGAPPPGGPTPPPAAEEESRKKFTKKY